MGRLRVNVSIKADTMDKLTFIIPKKLEDIGIVNAKLTMITTETQVPSAHSRFQFYLEPQLFRMFSFHLRFFILRNSSLTSGDHVAVDKSTGNAHRTG